MLKREKYDVAVIGAGFAGCLTALILWRLGLRVVLIERGSHPRFAIGESSTPLADLYLENLCREYHFPLIQRLCKYGSWQRSFPALGCGLKRGFSFFKHEENQPFLPRPGHENELLVAASPGDQLGDTHWYRQDVGNFLFQQTLATHVRSYFHTELHGL